MTLEKPDSVQQFISKEMLLAEIAKRGKNDPLVRVRLQTWFKEQDLLGMSSLLAKRMASEFDMAEVYEALGDHEAMVDTLKDALLDAEDTKRRADKDAAEEAQKWINLMTAQLKVADKHQNARTDTDAKAA